LWTAAKPVAACVAISLLLALQQFLLILGILASAGSYVFAKNGSDYDLKNMGVGNRGAVEGLSKIVALIHAGVLPKTVSYSAVEDLMGQGKLAMMISGPWAWSNLIKNGM
jgi:maltose/maltodextrin transport system substrate-binding protein